MLMEVWQWVEALCLDQVASLLGPFFVLRRLKYAKIHFTVLQ